jgi:hypothetical protein
MRQFLLWTAAVFITIAAVIYQRATGPTYPVKGVINANNQEYKYKLIRTHETTAGAKISLPKTEASDFKVFLNYKRFQTTDSMTVVPFVLDGDTFTAELPKQPAAGKMEYFVSGSIDNNEFRVPQKGEDNIVLRYKDPVPGGVLWPHVFMMFFAILFGMRAALSALFDPKTMRKWAIVALIGMSIGGMVLGPFVQKYAFGEYWTGFPYGGDFTDNKMLIMWLSWVFALAIIGFKPKKKEKISRVVVLMAAVVMTMVYLIPHSMGGSTLDYDKIDKGIDPTEAIKTGAN